MSAATLRSWALGRPYRRANGMAFFEPLLQLDDPAARRLSFTNLVEAHVLLAVRKVHDVPVPQVRTALRYAEQRLGIDRLLARLDLELLAGPGGLFLTQLRELVNLSQSGQLAMRQLLESHLRRVLHDGAGRPVRLFPFVPWRPRAAAQEPREPSIVIDPRISFGRPTLAGRGISTAILVDRVDAGESPEDVAEDYGLEVREVEEAILYERAA